MQAPGKAADYTHRQRPPEGRPPQAGIVGEKYGRRGQSVVALQQHQVRDPANSKGEHRKSSQRRHVQVQTPDAESVRGRLTFGLLDTPVESPDSRPDDNGAPVVPAKIACAKRPAQQLNSRIYDKGAADGHGQVHVQLAKKRPAFHLNFTDVALY